MEVQISTREWRDGALVAGLSLALSESAFAHLAGAEIPRGKLLARMALSCAAVALPLLFVPLLAFRLRHSYGALVMAGAAALVAAPVALRVRVPGWPLSAAVGSLLVCCLAAWLGRALGRSGRIPGLLPVWGILAVLIGGAEALLRGASEPVRVSAWAALATAALIVLELLRGAFAARTTQSPPLGAALLALLVGVGVSAAWTASRPGDPFPADTVQGRDAASPSQQSGIPPARIGEAGRWAQWRGDADG